MIEKQNNQVELMDKLVQSRFVEMFGDPILNNKCFHTVVGERLFKLSNGKAVPEGKRGMRQEFRHMEVTGFLGLQMNS